MLLFFSCVFFLLLLLFAFLRFGRMQITIENFEKSSITKKQDEKMNLIISYLFGEYLTLFKIRIKEKGKPFHQKTWNRLEKIIKEKGWMSSWKKELEKISIENIREILEYSKKEKKLKIKIRSLNLSLKLGVEDVILTSYFVAILSSLTSIFLSIFGKGKWRRNYQYQYIPIYQGKLEYDFKINLKIQIPIWKVLKIAWKIYYLKREKEKLEKQVPLPN